jgi:hypothetical protein
MQYSSRIKQRTLEKLSPQRQRQVEIALLLKDMVHNNEGWKIYEKWLVEQYEEALTKLKTAPAEEVLEYQTVIRYVESIKMWLTNTIERGEVVGKALISETTEGG